MKYRCPRQQHGRQVFFNSFGAYFLWLSLWVSSLSVKPERGIGFISFCQSVSQSNLLVIYSVFPGAAVVEHTDCPDSPKTFPGTCKGNFLCLQMISFEFLRVYSIGWIVSRGKHFVHMTRPGARDRPAACFSRPISHTTTFTTIQQVNK